MVNNGLRNAEKSARVGESSAISALFSQIRAAKEGGLTFHRVTDFGFSSVTPKTPWCELSSTSIIIIRALFRVGVPHRVTDNGLHITISNHSYNRMLSLVTEQGAAS